MRRYLAVAIPRLSKTAYDRRDNDGNWTTGRVVATPMNQPSQAEPAYRRRFRSPFTAADLFAIAGDIESYPDYVPWCLATRIRQRRGERLDVDNVFGAALFRLRFRTRATFEPPGRIEIVSNDRPFRHLRIVWRFEDLPDGGCQVELSIAHELRWFLANRLAPLFAEQAEDRIVAAFERRARALLGNKAPTTGRGGR
jgi:coenzyme Q-binding protein COQ10